jgi:gliding motility-associated lipoprotein GldD
VYGILYDIKGDAASNTQFFLTDSTHNFIRGALYFEVHPNKDSLAPVLEFINKDLVHLIETFEWN